MPALRKGRTARVIMTMDTPRWVDRWLYGSRVIKSSEPQRNIWLGKVAQLAKR